MNRIEIGSPLHWSEGLFLRQHHLQQLQHFMLEELQRTRQLPFAYDYGVIEAELAQDVLANFQIQFKRLRVVMPNGLEVQYSGNLDADNLDLPPRDIKAEFSREEGGLLVSLGVPFWQKGQANVLGPRDGADGRTRVLYQVKEESVTDENTGANAQGVEVRKIRGRIFCPGEKTDGWWVLPLRRIIADVGNNRGLPMEDPGYAPPCLVMSGSANLYNLVDALLENLEAHRRSLYALMKRADSAQEGAEERQLRFRTLNRFGGRFGGLRARLDQAGLEPGASMLDSPLGRTPPLAVYLELRELLGELACFYLDQDWPTLCARYKHDALFSCFKDLDDKIREMLRWRGPEPLRLDLTLVPNPTVWMCRGDLTEQHLAAEAFYLAIETGAPYDSWRDFVLAPHKFRVVQGRQTPTVKVLGVPLVEQRYTPALPQRGDVYYFRLDKERNPEVWAKIRTDRAIAVVSEQRAEVQRLGNPTLRLYMTVANPME